MTQAEGYTNIGAEAFGAMDEALMDNRLRNAIGVEAVQAMDAAYAENHTVDVNASLAVETVAHLERKGAGASNRAERRHHSSGSHVPEVEATEVAHMSEKEKAAAKAAKAEATEAKIAEAKAGSGAMIPRRQRQIANTVLHGVVRAARAEGTSPAEADAFVI